MRLGNEPQQLTPERWRQVTAIVADALEMSSPAARSELILERCRGDAALKREVESLLAQTTKRIEAYADDAGNAARADIASLPIGRRIGAYAVIRELGRGGMGAVYLARRADQEFEKEVAIKLLKRGTDTDEVLRRFRSEREILARLEHPNVARLIDAGTTDDGLPYFVMEYVAGSSITSYCNGNALAMEDRLELFLKVCAAVQFAHQNLIVHRDLKPANILVTADGEPKLLDFGIAKLLGADDAAVSITLADQQRLTAGYASPEQVRGQPITTVSDVYALGALLYELLGGQPAHRFSVLHPSSTELLKVIGEVTPSRPSAVAKDAATSRRLRGDLDNIILQALRKEPARRYSGVSALADDVRRHLENFPVCARKDTLVYRTSKLIQRNRIGVAAAVLIFLALAGGLYVSLVERAKAVKRFNQVRELAHAVLFDYHDAIATLPGSTAVRQRLVQDALKYLDNLAKDAGNDPGLLRELGAAYLKIAQIEGNSYYANLGDTAGARRSYETSLKIRQKLLAADPTNASLQSELAESYHGLGDVFAELDDLHAGVDSYERARKLATAAAAADPHDIDRQIALAEIDEKLGDMKGLDGFPNLGDTAGALASFREALDILERLYAANPQHADVNSKLANVLSHLGMLFRSTGDLATAVSLDRRAIDLIERLSADLPDNQSYQIEALAARNILRFALEDNDQIPEAISESRKLLAALERMVASDPKDSQLRRNLGVTYNSLGKELLASDNPEGALENHRKALQISDALLAADPASAERKSDVAFTLQRLGEAEAAKGDKQAALNDYGKALALREAAMTSTADNPRAREDLSSLYADLGTARVDLGDYTGATEAGSKAVALAEEISAQARNGTKTRVSLAFRYADLGKIYLAAAQAQKNRNLRSRARDYLGRSLAIWQELRDKGLLAATNARQLDEVSRQIAKCEAIRP
jgi:serine/threonine protein kinase/tetratricopeptide (TPR) repeat protein